MRLLKLSPEDAMKIANDMEKEANNIVLNAQRLSWYMRGGIDFVDIMNMSRKQLDNLNLIIEENMENTKKTKMPFF